MSSRRGTTTARVAEVSLTRAEYCEALRSSLERDGHDPSSFRALEEADGLADLAASWPVDTVVERRLDLLSRRTSSNEMPA